MGTIAGIVTGWIIARIVAAVAQTHMKNQGIPPVDMFALPAGWFSLPLVLA